MKFGNICSFKIPKAKIVPVLLNFDDFFPCEKEPCHTQRGGEATSKAAAPAPRCAFPPCCKLPGGDPCWLPAVACHLPPPRLLAAVSSACCQGSSGAGRKKPSVFKRRQGCEGGRARNERNSSVQSWVWAHELITDGCGSMFWEGRGSGCNLCLSTLTAAGNRGRIITRDTCRCMYKREHM